MGPVSVYRVAAVGADPTYVFGYEARDSDLHHAVWLGWLPLTLVGLAGPGVALAADTCLTAPARRSGGLGHAAPGDIVMKMNAPTDAHQAKVFYEGELVEDPWMRRGGVLSHRLCELRVLPVSAVPPSVPGSGPLARVTTPIVNSIPIAVQSSCARSMFGLCPFSSDRIAFSGRPASRAARLVPQPRCFSCACTSSASWRLAGPVGFLFIRVFTLSIRVFTPVLHVAVFGWDTDPRIALVPRSSRAAVELLGSRRRCPLLRCPGPTRRWRHFALVVAGLVYVRVLRAFARPVDFSLQRRACF